MFHVHRTSRPMTKAVRPGKSQPGSRHGAETDIGNRSTDPGFAGPHAAVPEGSARKVPPRNVRKTTGLATLPLIIPAVILLSGSVSPVFAPAAAAPVHTTYHWHLQQPIYWPERTEGAPNRYEKAYDSAIRKEGGGIHPMNDLESIFGKDDRTAVYQYRVRDALGTITQPDGGAQTSYSGCLAENTQSLAANWKYGYYPGWEWSFREARGWTTSGGRPKLDLVQFPFHHCLAPLVDPATLRKEIQLYREMYRDVWGSNPAISGGFFPPELAFSERIIPVLAEEGIAWTFVSNSHISRCCTNFPLTFGTGGEMCDPPNRADKLNPPQDNWFGEQIDRGCTPVNAYPFAYQAHYARYVDPYTGAESKIIVVPVAMVMSWRDGYSRYGTEDIDKIAWANDPARPMIIVLGHDGDNAYGGGYSYYMENVRDFCNEAAGAGYEPTVVAEFLADHPVPAGDIVHVEDGAWVNADGDFGSPDFWNWNWPPVNGSGDVDIAGGWALDERNWAVITAAQNRVETAEQIAGGARIAAILDPYGAGAGEAELAWHFFLPAVTSGYMYYGSSLDMEVKQTIACNNAADHADAVIGDGSGDMTPPTIWAPQRYPHNPGGTGFGSLYGYEETTLDRDFWVWSFVYDVSGIDSLDLFYRLDGDGFNSPYTDDNETYAGGGDVGEWRRRAMTRRAFPAWNFHGDPGIDFFEMPEYIADEYYYHFTDDEVVAEGDVLVDYFIRAVDGRGYEKRSDILHVYVDTGGGPGSGDPPFVMDGAVDSGARLIKSNGGMGLWTSYDRNGGWFYVATQASPASADHFILIAEEPGSPAGAPWAKSGTVASWDCYLADEGLNDFDGWFDLPGNVRYDSASGAGGVGALEGYFSVTDLLGEIPEHLSAAVAVYDTEDGGVLTWQVPGSGAPPDGNIDAGEYFPVRLLLDVAAGRVNGKHPASGAETAKNTGKGNRSDRLR